MPTQSYPIFWRTLLSASLCALSIDASYAATPIIIDDGDPNATLRGNWAVFSSAGALNKDALKGEGITTSSGAYPRHTWVADLPAAGEYKVSIRYPRVTTGKVATAATVIVKHEPNAVGQQYFTKYFDQTKNGDVWQVIGTFKFPAHKGVVFMDRRKAGIHVVDAVKFEAIADTLSPSTPTGVTLSVLSATEINLSWSAATDNKGVIGYRVYRDGVQIADVLGTVLTYTDRGLDEFQRYVYTLKAYDAAGNVSALTSQVAGRTSSTNVAFFHDFNSDPLGPMKCYDRNAADNSNTVQEIWKRPNDPHIKVINAGRCGKAPTVEDIEFTSPFPENQRQDRATIVQNGCLEGQCLKVFHKGYPDNFIAQPTDWNGQAQGGVGWRLRLKPAEEYYVSYWVNFESGFDFSMGGKIPGPCGGLCPTGNTPNDPDHDGVPDGWAGRMMWGKEDMVQYLRTTDYKRLSWEEYLADTVPTRNWTTFSQELRAAIASGDNALVNAIRRDFNKYEHGRIPTESLVWKKAGGENYKFTRGTWHHVEMRMRMNTPGKYDGILQTWFDGMPALDRSDIRYRLDASYSIDQFYLITMYGGGSLNWKPRNDGNIFFDNIVISTKKLGQVR